MEGKFEEIYKAIQEIREESQYSGWRDIADRIEKKVKELENILRDEIKALITITEDDLNNWVIYVNESLTKEEVLDALQGAIKLVTEKGL